MFKQSVTWNRVTEKLPEKDKDYLVWTGHVMIVSTAHMKHEDQSLNKFAEFGENYYFDNPNVYWAELPLAPGEKNPPPPDPYEGMEHRNIYLKKVEEGTTVIVGLHAIGYPGPYECNLHALDGTVTKVTRDFQAMEVWGNEYDDEHNMLGRGSFRVHTDIETAAKEFESDGFVRFEGPKKKDKNGTDV